MEYLSNGTMLESIWKGLDEIGGVSDEDRSFINQTVSDNSIDPQEINDFIANKTLNERIDQGEQI